MRGLGAMPATVLNTSGIHEMKIIDAADLYPKVCDEIIKVQRDKIK